MWARTRIKSSKKWKRAENFHRRKTFLRAASASLCFGSLIRPSAMNRRGALGPAVNRLVAGSNPARGAKPIKGLAQSLKLKSGPRYNIGTQGAHYYALYLGPCPRRLSGHAKPPRTRGTQRRERYCRSKAGRICHDNALSFKGLDIRSRPLAFKVGPRPLQLGAMFTGFALLHA